ncbi:MAG: hypothetical protein WDW36_009542 [Sanguina aurantia]
MKPIAPSRPFFASRSARALSLPSSSRQPRTSAPLVAFPNQRLRSSMPNRAPPRLQQVVEADELESASSASASASTRASASSVRSRPWDARHGQGGRPRRQAKAAGQGGRPRRQAKAAGQGGRPRRQAAAS